MAVWVLIDPPGAPGVPFEREVSHHEHWAAALQHVTQLAQGDDPGTVTMLTLPEPNERGIDKHGLSYQIMVCTRCHLMPEDIRNNPHHNGKVTAQIEDGVFYVTPHADTCIRVAREG